MTLLLPHSAAELLGTMAGRRQLGRRIQQVQRGTSQLRCTRSEGQVDETKQETLIANFSARYCTLCPMTGASYSSWHMYNIASEELDSLLLGTR